MSLLLSTSQVRLITDKVTNKPRGYAFIEYMHTRDMKSTITTGLIIFKKFKH